MLIALVSIALTVFAFTAAFHALLNKRDSKAALGWIAFCLILPLMGPLFYLLFGINRVTTRAQKKFLRNLEVDQAEPVFEPEGTSLRPFSMVGELLSGQGLRSCESVEILEDGENLYPQMLKAIREAKSRVYLCTYIFENNHTGELFIQALADAKLRGVEVRVIVDGLGEFLSFPNPRVGGKLNESGIPFVRFNPLSIFPPSLNINMRNHRKILVVDGMVAFTGGQNIGDRHLVQKKVNRHRATDLHFLFKGKIVDDFERAFLIDWNHCHGGKLAMDFKPSNEQQEHSQIWSRIILDGPNEHLNRLNELLFSVISSANTRVWIVTPYFLPGPELRGAMVAARLRGVDVRILLPRKSNIFLANWATQHILWYYLSKEIKVYFIPEPFIHTKAMIIDNHYATVGSANLDPRSLRLNFELVVEVFSVKFNKQLAKYFKAKLSSAELLQGSTLAERSFPIRVRDALAWLFSPYL